MTGTSPRSATGTGRSPQIRLAIAALIGVLLVLHAMHWSPSQMLWACHVASLIVAIGLALDLPRVLAVGMLFHAGQGIPAYILDLFLVGENSITSVLLHTLPIGAAAWALWSRPLPRGILFPAWLIQPGSMIAAYVLTDPKLNVMLVHEPYGPTAALFPQLWMSWLSNLAMSLGCLLIGWLVLRLIWKRWT
jgi:hypothetical protein